MLEMSGGERRNFVDTATPAKLDSIRQGAAEALACLVESLGVQLVPYAVLFMVPLLGRMSDQNQSVRWICSATFATLVQLLPLDPGLITDPPDLVYVNSYVQQRKLLCNCCEIRKSDWYILLDLVKIKNLLQSNLQILQQLQSSFLYFDATIII